MSVFDTDLIEKDLPLEDIIHAKVTDRVESVTYHINEKSARGVTVFNRLTERGFYGGFDMDWEWNDRYMAFTDYLNVSLDYMMNDINTHHMTHDKSKVFIDKVEAHLVNAIKPNQIRVILNYHTISQHILSWKRQDYRIEFEYILHLDPPTCPPEDLHFPFVI